MNIQTAPLVTRDLDDMLVPGVMVEVTVDEAERIGLIEEPAVTAAEAWDANGDPHESSGVSALDDGLAMRRRAVANAIATQRLEGLEVDPQTVDDLNRAALGELTPADVMRRIRDRISAGYYHDPSAAAEPE
jgi:hypothetical protein